MREPMYCRLAGGGPARSPRAPLPRRRRSSGTRGLAPAAGALLAAGTTLASLVLLAALWPREGGAAGLAANARELLWGPRRLAYPLWWFAPFYSGSGYGGEAISYIAALLGPGALDGRDVWLTHAGDVVAPSVVRSMEPGQRELLERHEYARLAKGALPPPELARRAIAICHTFPACWGRRGAGADDGKPMAAPGCPCPPEGVGEVAYRVGRTMFETAGLPRRLVDHCNDMDEARGPRGQEQVWVPTEFNRETFAAAGVDRAKLRVVEEGINTTHWDPARFRPLDPIELGPLQLTGQPRGRARSGAAGAGGKPFVFLSVFKLEARKGWDVLLDAFLGEFGADEDVELHILTKAHAGAGRGKRRSAGAIMWRWLERAKGLDRAAPRPPPLPRVYAYSGHVADGDYPRLYLGADAVVLPTRGEGWGRPQMEAMALGRPVITTNWSGPTAYMDDRVAYPLAIDGLGDASQDMNVTDPDARDPWFDGQLWARPSVAHLRTLMRRVVERPGEAAARGRAARLHVARRFSPEVLAARVRNEVLRIQAELATAGVRASPHPLAAMRSRAPSLPPAAGAVSTGGAIAASAHSAAPRGSGGGDDSGDAVALQLQGLAAQASAAGFTHGGSSLGFGIDTVRLTLAELLGRADLELQQRAGPSLRGVPIARSGGAAGPLVLARGDRAAAGAMVRLGRAGGEGSGTGVHGSVAATSVGISASKAPIGFVAAPGGPDGFGGSRAEAGGEEEEEEAEDAEWGPERDGDDDGAIVLHPA